MAAAGGNCDDRTIFAGNKVNFYCDSVVGVGVLGVRQ